MNKKILITGATGFIGSHLVELLIEKGYSVVAFDRYSINNDWGWLENSKFKTQYSQFKNQFSKFGIHNSQIKIKNLKSRVQQFTIQISKFEIQNPKLTLHINSTNSKVRNTNSKSIFNILKHYRV